MKTRILISLIFLFIGIITLTSCEETRVDEDIEQGVEQTGDALKDAGDKTGDAIEDAADGLR